MNIHESDKKEVHNNEVREKTEAVEMVKEQKKAGYELVKHEDGTAHLERYNEKYGMKVIIEFHGQGDSTVIGEEIVRMLKSECLKNIRACISDDSALQSPSLLGKEDCQV